MKMIMKRMFDESEFLSDFGIRSLSKYHKENPYQFRINGDILQVDYTPAESTGSMFGGNSNWRGPIWFPMNFLLIDSLLKFQSYYECNTVRHNNESVFYINFHCLKPAAHAKHGKSTSYGCFLRQHSKLLLLYTCFYKAGIRAKVT